MRFLLSALLAVMLVVTMPLALTGAATAEASQTASIAETSVPPAAHECCTPQPGLQHGDCTACAAIGHAEVTPNAARLPRRIRHIPALQDNEIRQAAFAAAPSATRCSSMPPGPMGLRKLINCATRGANAPTARRS